MQDTFTLVAADYARQHEAIHGVRRTVFVQGQGIDPALEADDQDAKALHVLALSSDDQPIGTARLTPTGHLGRMAVLAHWRNHGVGQAMLEWLCEQARQRGIGAIELHAQLPAYTLYARMGFLPIGTQHEEAGLLHQTMRRRLNGAVDIRTPAAAAAALASVIHNTGRQLRLISPQLDPGLIDDPLVFGALRALATRRAPKQIHLLVDAPESIARDSGIALALIQRLPSVFSLRQRDPDSLPPSPADALAINDRGWWYLRNNATSIEGRCGLSFRAGARPVHDLFARQWASSLSCDLLRNLSI